MSNFAETYAALSPRFVADGVLELLFDAPHLNAVTAEMHADLGRVWRDIEYAPDVRSVVIRGANGTFSAGGSFDIIEKAIEDPATRTKLYRETRDIVVSMIECSKPIVSGIRGTAVGAGLVVGLLSDISVVSRTARLVDGHTRLGIAAGDHSVISWPLLCGMAKAKYLLLMCDPITGEEAERIGLVSLSLEDEEVDARALDIATRLGRGAQDAIRFTKQALNYWYRANGAAFDFSTMAEMFGLGGPDIREGLASLREKRPPRFVSDTSSAQSG
ncbi:enoyl-CoA hydratase/isomerase family protein [Streptomyces rhizosphaericus]|uniref:Enoyl-CoA hydratase/isomerase family protein n=1 Tax=Streptomyces rhizosphaericus TaxID=114699 RepID=A0A6G4A7M8_9ACTN|nr:enoyl-CoA hydratase/isomerase family protein [Streptomyces rhizosphaericus]NEW69272.1 enoyl-CoA hydratase/isomerase family protein [Streptomyces rhizosphaericus]